MARASIVPVDEAGPGEDWITIDYFPIWGIGNMVWEARDGVRNETWSCHNNKRWNLDPYLQLERKGNVFHLRTSVDGVTWSEMACSPKTRNDFAGLPLQVGLRHATYSSTLGYVAFDDFRLEIIVKLKATNPVPTNGAGNVETNLLAWKPGDRAAKHDVYLGTSFADVNNADTSTPDIYKGRQDPNTFTATNLIPGTVYYWRIDEVNLPNIWRGDVWSFTPISMIAWGPSPADDSECVLTDADLIWGAGSTASRHEVYFGTDETAVTNATPSDPMGVYKGSQPGTTYEPGNLANNTTYFWRIDEVDEEDTTYTGRVWSFKTLADIPIYNPNLVGWWRLDGGCSGNNIVVDSSGYNRHGTLEGNPQWITGYHDGALQFDGRGDYVELPIGSLIGQLSNSTFMLWLDSEAGGSWVRAFDFGTEDPNVYMCLGPRWWFMDDMYFAITTSGEDNQILVQPTGFDIESGWQHVAVTIDADAGTIILYYNGEELARNTTAILLPKDLGNTTNNWLGRSHDPENSYYLGSMDDFRIYNYALTADEIVEVMNRPDPMIAWGPTPANSSIPDIEHTLPLSWSLGDNAVQHDVYFGTDANAVKNADISDTTGVYRGRQDSNSYSPPGGVEPNQVYYWRIDEVHTDATISTGRVWSFTVADYLIVDDFEDYDDVGNIIYYTWEDYYVNNTGMTVGHLEAPYAEQIIVHSSSQAMYMRYDNDGTVNEGTPLETAGTLFYSEAQREWQNPQDWTRRDVNSLTIWFRGIPASVGSFTPTQTGYTITAAGADIWGTADQFHFAYKQLSGNGSITAKVVSLTNTHNRAKAGVMIRETLDADSAHTMVCFNPEGRVEFLQRPFMGDASLEIGTAATEITTPVSVRLTRTGNTFTAEYSATGNPPWTQLGSVNMPMLPDAYIGLIACSHDNNATCTAEFSNITTSGTGDWQSQDIGIQSNVAEQLYVLLQDSANNSAVVKHPDPAATTFSTWTQWDIPLSAFTGVNLQSVTKLSIGVGDRAATQPAGAGDLYIDDIRLYIP
jgi:regulation of enolase protein 1 (concanavalin A-like superfamily)